MSAEEEQQPLFDPGPVVNPQTKPLTDSAEPRAKIDIDIYGSATLTEEELWPNGDAPENWTAKHAKEVIDEVGLKKLMLLDDLDITIYVPDSPDDEKWA